MFNCDFNPFSPDASGSEIEKKKASDMEMELLYYFYQINSGIFNLINSLVS